MDTEQELPLQAVVLADAFEYQARYGPLVRGGGKDGEGCDNAQPWCLLPFLNAPLIAWTLESLSASNVQQIFIIIREGAKELQTWLDSSTYSPALPTSTMEVRIRSTLASAEGDVLRELDNVPLQGDFLLVRAGYMGNIDLDSAVKAFTVRRKKDPSLLMDCLVAPRSVVPRAKSSTHVLAPTGQLLHFTHHARFPHRKRMQFPRELLESGQDLTIRTDLESIGVDICNVELPALFVENFDYQNLRPDFIHGILTSDLLTKTIRCTVVGAADNDAALSVIAGRAKPYATCVGDLASYDQNSFAILARWAHPLTLDETVPGTHERYEQRRGRLYLGKDVALARSCVTGPSAVIGHRSTIGEHTSVSHSVLGPNCRIGRNVTISHSYIFEGVMVEDGCVIENSIVGYASHVRSGAIITQGTIVGPYVTLSEKSVLESQTVSVEAYSSSAISNGSADDIHHLWPSEEDRLMEDVDSDDEEALDHRNLRMSKLHRNVSHAYLSDTSSVSELSDSSSSDTDEGESLASEASGGDSENRIAGISALDTSAESEDFAFLQECLASLERSFGEDHTVENTAIELKTLRMASNVTLKRVIGVVVPFLCNRAHVKIEESNRQVDEKADNMVERWGNLITSLTSGQQDGMVDALLALQHHCASTNVHPRLFAAFLQAYYNEDVISDDAAVSWVKDPRSRSVGDEAGLKLWNTGAAFVKALIEADDDSDEDDEDE